MKETKRATFTFEEGNRLNFVPAVAAKINISVPFCKLTARGWDPSNQMACSGRNHPPSHKVLFHEHKGPKNEGKK